MLRDEIEIAQKDVRTDAYQMSIGEIVSLYRDRDLIIDPEFQRLFRWEIGQKSRFIESLILGIPVPSIFVFETEDAKWELIDGLQRVSTVLEFMGQLRHPGSNEIAPPSSLVSTHYLPSLSNTVWEKSDQILDVPVAEQVELDKAYQLSIRRARLGVEILKRPSDNNTKYDLFQRLNAGGTAANPQELRNCIMIMVNRDYYAIVKSLAERKDFLDLVAISEDQLERQKHLEYASRFLVYTFIQYDGKKDVEEHIDRGMIELARQSETQVAGSVFIETFSLLNNSLGPDALRRFDGEKHTGRVGLVALECIAVGIARNIAAITKLKDPQAFVSEKVRTFWAQPELRTFLSQGMRGTTRIQKTIPFGEQWFRP